MAERILPSPALQVLFVSRETSKSPLFGDLARIGRILDQYINAKQETGIISYDYGRRLIMTGKNTNVTQMSQDDIVEIVDYDPLKNIMMVIGTKEPCLEAPVHWIIQKARHDINVLLQLHSPPLATKLQGTIPSTDTTTPKGTLDQAKELLKTLRKGKTLLIPQDNEILFAGINIQEIERSIALTLKGPL